MRYLSLFSGIEAATVAWQDFGWECVGLSEIDPFPCEVLRQRYPNLKNLGDITKITRSQLYELDADVIVGGSPCQSFSSCGKRQGLDDKRGRLMYEYIRVVETIRPSWFIWENVPGVLSQDNGRSFGTFLTEMANIGYHLSWRVLDAKYFGVPQRRRRVYVVGNFGTDPECTTQVLFDPYCRNRDLRESFEKKQADTGNSEKTAEQFSQFVDLYNCSISTEAGALTTATGASSGTGPKVISHNKIRRLTPVECERLQGFPDNYTQIKWRGKSESECPDGHRYKALGNSMAVPVMRWIGYNIMQYDERFYLPW